MPIVSTDIEYRMSGGASNSDPNLSIGGVMSSTAFTDGAVFDDVLSGEATSGDVNYRCFYVYNAHATLTLQGARIWIQSQSSSPDTDIALALDGVGLNGTAEAPADEASAPVGETFSAPADYAGGLVLGDLAPGDSYPIWVRRVVTAGAAAAVDTWTLRTQGDTNP